jgi:hypothetical protein
MEQQITDKTQGYLTYMQFAFTEQGITYVRLGCTVLCITVTNVLYCTTDKQLCSSISQCIQPPMQSGQLS